MISVNIKCEVYMSKIRPNHYLNNDKENSVMKKFNQ